MRADRHPLPVHAVRRLVACGGGLRQAAEEQGGSPRGLRHGTPGDRQTTGTLSAEAGSLPSRGINDPPARRRTKVLPFTGNEGHSPLSLEKIPQRQPSLNSPPGRLLPRVARQDRRRRPGAADARAFASGGEAHERYGNWQDSSRTTEPSELCLTSVRPPAVGLGVCPGVLVVGRGAPAQIWHTDELSAREAGHRRGPAMWTDSRLDGTGPEPTIGGIRPTVDAIRPSMRPTRLDPT